MKNTLSKLFLLSILCIGFTFNGKAQTVAKHSMPDLPFAYNALEPYIDTQTMELHYSKHYKGYYSRFMSAIEGTEMENQSMEEIFSSISTASVSVRNNGGGYYNHMLFWENLSPNQGAPSKDLLLALTSTFGSIEAFKEAFNKAAGSVFGSGWAWLILTSDNKLEIVSTSNQDNPLMDIAVVKGKPLLTLDVWEHAYYLKYQNKRPDYIQAFWSVVNWNTVNTRFAKAMKND